MPSADSPLALTWKHDSLTDSRRRRNTAHSTYTTLIILLIVLISEIGQATFDTFLSSHHSSSSASTSFSSSSSSSPFLVAVSAISSSELLSLDHSLSVSAPLAVDDLLSQSSLSYSLLRPDIQIDFKFGLAREAKQALKNGIVDAAIVNGFDTLSDEEQMAYPDIIQMPLFLQQTAIAYSRNIDRLGTQPLVLSLPVIARIYYGNITHWSDPSLAALNPTHRFPHSPIRLAMGETIQLNGQDVLCKVLARVDPLFSLHFPCDATHFHPPLSSYAASPLMSDDIHFLLSSMATTLDALSFGSVWDCRDKFGLPLADIVNGAGTIVAPTVLSVTLPVFEVGFPLQNNVADLTTANGPYVYPFVQYYYLQLSKTYLRSTCAQKREVLSFILWLYESSEAAAVSASLMSPFVPTQVQTALEIITTLHNDVECLDRVPIYQGQSNSVSQARVFGSSDFQKMFSLFFQIYQTDYEAAMEWKFYEGNAEQAFALMDSDGTTTSPFSLDSESDAPMDVAFAASTTHDPDNGKLHHSLPFATQGARLVYNLPKGVTSAMINYEPLVLDLETVGMLFSGSIRSWLHDRIARLNPSLTIFLRSHSEIDPSITLVLCCGEQRGTQEIWSRVRATLIHTASFGSSLLASSSDWSLIFNNNSAVSSSLPLPNWKIGEDESMQETLVLSIPGSIGYARMDSPSANDGVHVRLLPWKGNDAASMEHVLSNLDAGGFYQQAANESIAADPTHSRACIAFSSAPDSEGGSGGGASFDGGAMDAIEGHLDFSRRSIPSDCWPLTIAVQMLLPVHYSDSSALSSRRCDQARQIVQFSSWLVRSPILTPIFEAKGFARVADNNPVYLFLNGVLNDLTCDGRSLLQPRPDVWQMSQAIVSFVVAWSTIQFILHAITLIFLYVSYQHAIVAKNSPILLLLSLFGAVLMNISCILWMQAFPQPNSYSTDTSQASYFSQSSPLPSIDSQYHLGERCSAFHWLLQLGFTLCFLPPVMKMWRMSRMIERINTGAAAREVEKNKENEKNATIKRNASNNNNNSHLHHHHQPNASGQKDAALGTAVSTPGVGVSAVAAAKRKSSLTLDAANGNGNNNHNNSSQRRTSKISKFVLRAKLTDTKILITVSVALLVDILLLLVMEFSSTAPHSSFSHTSLIVEHTEYYQCTPSVRSVPPLLLLLLMKGLWMLGGILCSFNLNVMMHPGVVSPIAAGAGGGTGATPAATAGAAGGGAGAPAQIGPSSPHTTQAAALMTSLPLLEAKQLSYVLYNFLFTCIIILPILLFLSIQGDALVMLVLILIFWNSFVALVASFATKVVYELQRMNNEALGRGENQASAAAASEASKEHKQSAMGLNGASMQNNNTNNNNSKNHTGAGAVASNHADASDTFSLLPLSPLTRDELAQYMLALDRHIILAKNRLILNGYGTVLRKHPAGDSVVARTSATATATVAAAVAIAAAGGVIDKDPREESRSRSDFCSNPPSPFQAHHTLLGAGATAAGGGSNVALAALPAPRSSPGLSIVVNSTSGSGSGSGSVTSGVAGGPLPRTPSDRQQTRTLGLSGGAKYRQLAAQTTAASAAAAAAAAAANGTNNGGSATTPRSSPSPQPMLYPQISLQQQADNQLRRNSVSQVRDANGNAVRSVTSNFVRSNRSLNTNSPDSQSRSLKIQAAIAAAAAVGGTTSSAPVFSSATSPESTARQLRLLTAANANGSTSTSPTNANGNATNSGAANTAATSPAGGVSNGALLGGSGGGGGGSSSSSRVPTRLTPSHTPTYAPSLPVASSSLATGSGPTSPSGRMGNRMLGLGLMSISTASLPSFAAESYGPGSPLPSSKSTANNSAAASPLLRSSPPTHTRRSNHSQRNNNTGAGNGSSSSQAFFTSSSTLPDLALGGADGSIVAEAIPSPIVDTPNNITLTSSSPEYLASPTTHNSLPINYSWPQNTVAIHMDSSQNNNNSAVPLVAPRSASSLSVREAHTPDPLLGSSTDRVGSHPRRGVASSDGSFDGNFAPGPFRSSLHVRAVSLSYDEFGTSPAISPSHQQTQAQQHGTPNASTQDNRGSLSSNMRNGGGGEESKRNSASKEENALLTAARTHIPSPSQ